MKSMKVELENLRLGISPITDEVFVGVLNKSGQIWLKKHPVTNDFIHAVISKWEGTKQQFTNDNGTFEVSVRKVTLTHKRGN